jgi:ribonuclease P protein component
MLRSLRSSAAIRSVFAARNAVHGRAMSVYARQVSDGGEVAVVVGRAVGNAVARNRAKRRLRAVIAGAAVPRALQLVVVARPAATTLPFPALVEEFARLVRRLVRRLEVAR